MRAAIQVCGTASGVGKSVIVSGLCRILLQEGFSVCPFKAQNMSLNSFVTSEGEEMGRAQVTQAQACRITAHSDMNPVLLKPTTDIGAQVIVQGKPIGNKTAREYQDKEFKKKLFFEVKDSFDRLSKEYDIIVMEGAGSPAEINLKRHDIVNMKMAEYAKAQVILVGDIDKGGVFASLIGTLELLEKKERERIKGFIINKFRGDKYLLKEGIDFLQKKTKKRVLGIIPYFKEIKIPEEDSLSLESRVEKTGNRGRGLNVAVIKLPHISNFTDFDPLERERGVSLKYVSAPEGLGSPDVIILPGSKNTIADLAWLKRSGLADKILTTYHSRLTTVLIGICGGYQMLGKKIYDAFGIESRKKETDGLGVLPIITYLEKEKTLAQVKGEELSSGLSVSGYEIHHGHSCEPSQLNPVFKITRKAGKTIEYFDGTIENKGRSWGTYIHGVFDEGRFRKKFLNRIRLRKGLPISNAYAAFNLDKEFDKLAQLIRENIDIRMLYKMMGLKL
ncbi:MAG: cobyric acid synthase [Candidatus Omnitrophota bacterium]